MVEGARLENDSGELHRVDIETSLRAIDSMTYPPQMLLDVNP